MNWLVRAYILAALLTFDARIVVHIEGAHNSASDVGRHGDGHSSSRPTPGAAQAR
ncbi:hypothetical protein [Caballeronia novacaledonica]|uniref:Uncharacterized protein n=1 Tax=Caballeronia novacaledonica TaxID=1544861 RepID=A0AA37MUL5_9BURK|nr:hypothetical protein [Caballeronia novacaledonica]GJH29607.1 hypothetical protein CBA19CS42_33845 [Caballeronia novacaledonica]